MREIDNYFNNKPLIAKTEKYQQLLKDLLTKKKANQKVNSSKDIKGYAPDEIKDALILIFGNNCAFCECDVSFGSSLDTEHFRPKSKYYWLAYEWTNFLRACKRCNTNKGVKFKINGLRVSVPNIDFEKDFDAFLKKCHIKDYLNEDCLFLHPVLDDPNEHLWFDENGVVHPKSDKGKYSINELKLNRNSQKLGDLVIERKKIIEEIRLRVERAVHYYTFHKNEKVLYLTILNIHADLFKSVNKKETFSAVRRTCVANFKTIFIDKFTGEQERVLNVVYDRIKINIDKAPPSVNQ